MRTGVRHPILAMLAALLACSATASEPKSEAEPEAMPEKPHWSFIPPTTPSSPTVMDSDWPRDPIDQFVLHAIEAEQLSPTADAPPATLIRRLHMDLIGLPPSAEEIRSFEAACKTDRQAAIASLVDQLLASPHFGERWGRHWLDVARYAESNGDDGLGRNATFPQAWRYRDYVIDALNRDTPYDRFLHEQIAGDLLPFETIEERNRNLVATGFLALGSKPAKAMNNNFAMDVVDDQINVVCTAVMGLSVACARCHDHKHDPIPTKDYYALAGLFTSTQTLYGKAGNEKLTAPPTPLHELKTSLKEVQTTGTSSPKDLKLPATFAAVIEAQAPLFHHSLTQKPEGLKTDKVTFTNDTFAAVKESSIRGSFAETNHSYSVSFWFKNKLKNNTRPITAYLFSRAPWGVQDMPGEHLGIGGTHDKERTGRLFVFNGRLTKKSIAGKTVIPPNTWNHVVMIRHHSRIKVFLNGQIKPEIDDKLPVTIGTHRDFCFATRSEKFAPLTGNIAHIAVWERPLSDGEARSQHAASGYQRGEEPKKSYPLAMGVRDRENPGDATFYNKGLTPDKKKKIPRALLTAHAAAWKPGPAIPAKQSGRLELAQWLTQPDHPQTARVMANRVWLHLFGQGLVQTPDDFGIYGAEPTHPQLLDHLAGRLVAEEWSLKRFIRLLVLSRSYQLDSVASPALIEADPDNRLNARHTRRRLDAETIRDRILAASGELDPSPGKGSAISNVVQLINWPPGNATNFHHPSRHRSIYLCMLRHNPPTEIAAFDLPDATCTLGQRNVSTLPTHALYLLNNEFVVAQSQALAQRVLADKNASTAERITALYQQVLQRSPSKDEAARALAYIKEQTAKIDDEARRWASLGQALFAANEFTTID